MKLSLLAITTLYPLLVYASLRYGSPHTALLLVGAIIGLRAYFSFRKRMNLVATLALALGAAVVAVALSSVGAYVPLLLPCFTNLALLALFSSSLLYPPSIIERIAVRMKGELPPEGIRHCRIVCQVWIAFFALNAVVSLDSAFRSLEWWSLYNGIISYCVAGSIFAVEYLVRRRVMKSVALRGTLAALMYGPLILPNCPIALAQQLTVEQLAQKLTPPGPFRTQFSEKRFVAVLSAPLESHGELHCLPQVGLVWETSTPVRRTALITPRGIRHLKDGAQGRFTADHAGVSEALLSLMSGEIAQAETNFTIEIGGTPEDWRVVLTPRDSLVAEVVRTISIFGSDRPRSIEIAHANGDKIVTSFTAPVTLVPDEIARAQKALSTSDD
jgi:uncharacterized membrane protein